jgi:hypothetical protein
MLRQYHTQAPFEKTNLPTVEALRLWRPGQPIPKNFNPDPWAALERHAAAHAAQNAPLPFRTRTRRPADVAADRKEAA